MRAVIAPSMILLSAAIATAQVPATPPVAAYCRSAAQALLQGAGDSEIAAVTQRCRRGDTIAVNAGSQGAVFAVGRLCDFSKPVVNVGPQVVCVLGAERGVR